METRITHLIDESIFGTHILKRVRMKLFVFKKCMGFVFVERFLHNLNLLCIKIRFQAGIKFEIYPNMCVPIQGHSNTKLNH